MVTHNVSSDQSPITTNRTNVTLYGIQQGEKYTVEILIIPSNVLIHPYYCSINISCSPASQNSMCTTSDQSKGIVLFGNIKMHDQCFPQCSCLCSNSYTNLDSWSPHSNFVNSPFGNCVFLLPGDLSVCSNNWTICYMTYYQLLLQTDLSYQLHQETFALY